MLEFACHFQMVSGRQIHFHFPEEMDFKQS